MALRVYWCVLSRRGTTAIRGRTVFNQVDQFTCELDPDMSYTVRAAFLNGLRQHAGEDADPGEFRMYIYADPGYSQVVLSDFTVPPPADAFWGADSLEGYSDDQILSELAWRLRGRPG
jgi:hypothetical protein